MGLKIINPLKGSRFNQIMGHMGPYNQYETQMQISQRPQHSQRQRQRAATTQQRTKRASDSSFQFFVSRAVWQPRKQEESERKLTEKMSGTGKKVVDVAFKASKNIDWEGMAKLLVSDEARKEFSTLRRAFDEVNSTLQTKFSQVCALLSLSLRFS